MTTTPAEARLAEFLKGGWDFASRLPIDGTEESLHLEFKQKKDASTGALHRTDRQHLSMALSGFANAEGGLVVWGVDARRGKDGVDRVRDLSPVCGLARFVSELQSLTPEMVSPHLQGVEHHPIEDPETPDTGIVVTIVPKGEGEPHMANGPKQHLYYRRTSSDFRYLEHYEVADLFGRRPQAVLSVTPSWSIGNIRRVIGGAVNQWDGGLSVVFIVKNTGRALARFPCFSVGSPSPEWRQTGQVSASGPFVKVQAPDPWAFRAAASSDGVMYPNDRYPALIITFGVTNLDQREDLELPYEAVADGCPVVRGIFRLKWEKVSLGIHYGGQSGGRYEGVEDPE